jgi:hypothetical protein
MTDLWTVLQQWQSFIAGFLVFVAGGITCAGALIAANRQAATLRLATDQQVAATRRAAEEQVAAVRRATDQQVAVVRRATEEQVASLQLDRQHIGERQHGVVECNVQIKGKRIEIAAVRRDAAPPDGQREVALPIARLVLESDPLPHGVNEEMALLDDRMRALFGEFASTIDEYISRTRTIKQLARMLETVER